MCEEGTGMSGKIELVCRDFRRAVILSIIISAGLLGSSIIIGCIIKLDSNIIYSGIKHFFKAMLPYMLVGIAICIIGSKILSKIDKALR